MRVIHLIDSGGYYGAERMVLELIRAQRLAGVDASLISHGSSGCASKAVEVEAERCGLPLECWRGNFLARLRRLLADCDEQVVLHSHGYKFNVPLALMPRRCRVVATAHGYTELRLSRKMGIYALLDRLALRHLDGVAVVATKVADDAGITLDGGRYQQIANGIEATVPVTKPLPEFLQARISGRPVVLSLGRLSSEKGLDTLICAFAGVVAACPQALLVIAGEGPLRGALEQQAVTLGLGESICFAGYLDNPDGLLAQVRLLAQPSLTEGMPMTVLEAMRLGVPVVATPVGSLPELLGERDGDGGAGKLVPCGDVGGLTDALVDLLGNQQRALALGACGRQRFVAQYSSSAMAARYLAFYHQCRNRGSRISST